MMTINKQRTLGGAIAGREAEFASLIHEAVEHSLIALGDRIYDLDWASMGAKIKHEQGEKIAA